MVSIGNYGNTSTAPPQQHHAAERCSTWSFAGQSWPGASRLFCGATGTRRRREESLSYRYERRSARSCPIDFTKGCSHRETRPGLGTEGSIACSEETQGMHYKCYGAFVLQGGRSGIRPSAGRSAEAAYSTTCYYKCYGAFVLPGGRSGISRLPGSPLSLPALPAASSRTCYKCYGAFVLLCVRSGTVPFTGVPQFGGRPAPALRHRHDRIKRCGAFVPFHWRRGIHPFTGSPHQEDFSCRTSLSLEYDGTVYRRRMKVNDHLTENVFP